MKKVVALMGLGGFLVVLAVAAPTYVYPRVAVVPGDLDSRVVAESPAGAPATFFSVPDLQERTAPLRSVTRATVDAPATSRAQADLGEGVIVLRIHACTDVTTVDCQSKQYALTAAVSTVAVDRRTGEAVGWSGNRYSSGGRERADMPFDGLVVKFPFHAGERTYPFWNASVERAVPARFVRTERLDGLRVHRYRATVEPTWIAALDLPGRVVGRPEASVRAARMFSATTDYLVEPETGVIMSAKQVQDSFAAIDGQRVLTITDGTFVGADDAVAATVAEYRGVSRQLWAVRVLPPVLGIVGGLMIITALLVVLLRGSGRRRERRAAPRPVAAPVG